MTRPNKFPKTRYCNQPHINITRINSKCFAYKKYTYFFPKTYCIFLRNVI